MHIQRGRPSKPEQLEFDKILRPYFERTLSAAFTAKETGFNIKTVCKYFDKWSKEIRETEDHDFFERQRKERARIILCYDDLISKAYGMINDIKSEIKKYKEEEKEIPKFCISSFQNVINTISNLIEKKCSLTIQPLTDEVIEQKIQEKLNTNVSS